MSTIFISYRRNDSADLAGRIFDRLVGAFSKRRVFKDVDSVPAGADFRRVIEQAVQKADVFILIIIGPGWLNATDDRGRRRLDATNDFVRMELECALKLDKVIIPVLVGQSAMPDASELPETLSEVAYRDAREVRRDPDFHRDMDRLIDQIKSRIAENARKQQRPDEQAKRWGAYLLGAVGLLVVIVVGYSRFAPDPVAQPPKTDVDEIKAADGRGLRAEPPNIDQSVTPNRAIPNVFPRAASVSAPAPPAKSLPGPIPKTAQIHPEIPVAQSGSRLPSAQGGFAPRPTEEAPPAPPAPRSGSISSPGESRDEKVASVNTSGSRTTPISVAQPSEAGPPPPLVSSVAGHLSRTR